MAGLDPASHGHFQRRAGKKGAQFLKSGRIEADQSARTSASINSPATLLLWRFNMLTRRFFTSCALCAAAGFVATEVGAQRAAAAPSFARKILAQMDGPADGYVTLAVEVDVEPGALINWHTHPGIESTFVVAGGIDLMVKSQPKRMLKSGEAFQIPPVTPHALQNGNAATKLAATFVVKKGQPLSTSVAAPA